MLLCANLDADFDTPASHLPINPASWLPYSYVKLGADFVPPLLPFLLSCFRNFFFHAFFLSFFPSTVAEGRHL